MKVGVVGGLSSSATFLFRLSSHDYLSCPVVNLPTVLQPQPWHPPMAKHTCSKGTFMSPNGLMLSTSTCDRCPTAICSILPYRSINYMLSPTSPPVQADGFSNLPTTQLFLLHDPTNSPLSSASTFQTSSSHLQTHPPLVWLSSSMT